MAFAREGAQVFICGRTKARLDAVAAQIGLGNPAAAARYRVRTAVVDALDAAQVEAHLTNAVSTAAHVDVSFNAIGLGDARWAPLAELGVHEFTPLIINALKTQFITGTAAGRHMAGRGSGVILSLTAQAGKKPYVAVGGFGVACAAMEALSRQLSAELGPRGIRVVVLRSSGSPDSPGVAEAFKNQAASRGISVAAHEASVAEATLLKRLPYLAEVANAAVIMASDYASTITASVANLTCGELVD
jgi:NAD(P)-dependent dehydrogenase (short-subunit alcohol dehydrogenase family)